jgi:hypothetical protein
MQAKEYHVFASDSLATLSLSRMELNTMKNPTLPGFNAEVAFYRARNRYRSGVTYHISEQAIIPQKMTWWEGIKCGAAVAGAAIGCSAATTGVGIAACALGTAAAVNYCDELSKD